MGAVGSRALRHDGDVPHVDVGVTIAFMVAKNTVGDLPIHGDGEAVRPNVDVALALAQMLSMDAVGYIAPCRDVAALNVDVDVAGPLHGRLGSHRLSRPSWR